MVVMNKMIRNVIIFILFLLFFQSAFSCDGNECWNDANFEDSMKNNPLEAMNRNPEKVMSLDPQLAISTDPIKAMEVDPSKVMEIDPVAGTIANPTLALDTNPSAAALALDKNINILDSAVIQKLETHLNNDISLLNNNQNLMSAYFDDKGIMAMTGVVLKDFENGIMVTDGLRGSKFNINDLKGLDAQILPDGFLKIGNTDISGDIKIEQTHISGEDDFPRIKLTTSNGEINIGEKNDNSQQYIYEVNGEGRVNLNGYDLTSKNGFTIMSTSSEDYLINTNGEVFSKDILGENIFSFDKNGRVSDMEFINGGKYKSYLIDDSSRLLKRYEISMNERTHITHVGNCNPSFSCIYVDDMKFRNVIAKGYSKIGFSFFDSNPDFFLVNSMDKNSQIDFFNYITSNDGFVLDGRVQFHSELGILSKPGSSTLKNIGDKINMLRRDDSGKLRYYSLTHDQENIIQGSGYIIPEESIYKDEIRKFLDMSVEERKKLLSNSDLNVDSSIVDALKALGLPYDSDFREEFFNVLSNEDIEYSNGALLEKLREDNIVSSHFQDYDYEFDLIKSLDINDVNPTIITDFEVGSYKTFEIFSSQEIKTGFPVYEDDSGNQYILVIKDGREYHYDIKNIGGKQVLVYEDKYYYDTKGNRLDSNGNVIDGKSSIIGNLDEDDLDKSSMNIKAKNVVENQALAFSNNIVRGFETSSNTLTIKGKEYRIDTIDDKSYVIVSTKNGNIKYEVLTNDDGEHILVYNGKEYFNTQAQRIDMSTGKIIGESSVLGIYGRQPPEILTNMEKYRRWEIVKAKAQERGMNPQYLWRVIGVETSGTYSPSIVNNWGATGLIQFTESGALWRLNNNLGYDLTIEDIEKMSFDDQLDVALDYLESYDVSGKDEEYYYMSIFAPAFRNKNNHDVVYEGNEYRANKQMDNNGDRVITVSEIKNWYYKVHGFETPQPPLIAEIKIASNE